MATTDRLLEAEYTRLQAEYARREMPVPRNPWFASDDEIDADASRPINQGDDE